MSMCAGGDDGGDDVGDAASAGASDAAILRKEMVSQKSRRVVSSSPSLDQQQKYVRMWWPLLGTGR